MESLNPPTNVPPPEHVKLATAFDHPLTNIVIKFGVLMCADGAWQAGLLCFQYMNSSPNMGTLAWRSYVAFSFVGSAVLSLTKIVGGVMCIRRTPAARRFVMLWAIAAIAFAVLNIAAFITAWTIDTVSRRGANFAVFSMPLYFLCLTLMLEAVTIPLLVLALFRTAGIKQVVAKRD